MAQGIQKLSAEQVRRVMTVGHTAILSDGGGLRLVVHANGSKYWQFRTAAGGKETTLQIGKYPDVGLAEARAKASSIRKQVSDGLDPALERKVHAVRQKVAKAATFRAVADELIAVKGANGISASYRAKIECAFAANLFPALGNLPIQQIDSPLLKEVLRPIAARGSLDMLKFVLRIAGEVFDLATTDGRYKGDNPTHSLRKNVFPKHTRGQMAALPWSQMAGFLHRLDGCYGEFATICCVHLMILTATRPGEARGAQWQEFDLDTARWTIPAERMKSRKEHWIPLARQAVEMLRQLRELTGASAYLFPGQRGAKAAIVSDMTILKAVRRTAGHSDVDAHGFRAVFRTHAEESGRWSFDAMEAALAHGKKNAVVASYARATHYPEREKLAQWYADELGRVKAGAEIIPLRGNTAA